MGRCPPPPDSRKANPPVSPFGPPETDLRQRGMMSNAEGLRRSARPLPQVRLRRIIPAEAGIHWGGLNTPQADTVTANLRRGALRCARKARRPQRTEGRAHLHLTPRPIPLVPPLAKGDDEQTQRGFAPLHAPCRRSASGGSFPRRRESTGVG